MKTLLEIVNKADYSQLARITVETEDERIYAAIKQGLANAFLNGIVREFNIIPKAGEAAD